MLMELCMPVALMPPPSHPKNTHPTSHMHACRGHLALLPSAGYKQGGASNGTSGGSAVSAAGWRFNICQDRGRCRVEPADGISQWYRRLWQVGCVCVCVFRGRGPWGGLAGLICVASVCVCVCQPGVECGVLVPTACAAPFALLLVATFCLCGPCLCPACRCRTLRFVSVQPSAGGSCAPPPPPGPRRRCQTTGLWARWRH